MAVIKQSWYVIDGGHWNYYLSITMKELTQDELVLEGLWAMEHHYYIEAIQVIAEISVTEELPALHLLGAFHEHASHLLHHL